MPIGWRRSGKPGRSGRWDFSCRELDFQSGADSLFFMSVAELQKTLQGLSPDDRRTLAAIAERMKRRHSAGRRRQLTAAMKEIGNGKGVGWEHVKHVRAERRKASDE